jgi:hypothetical protein
MNADLFQHETCATSHVDVDFDCPTLVMVGDQWAYHHPGRVRVPMVAFEADGPWTGPRTASAHSTIEDARKMLDMILRVGILTAFGVSPLAVEQPVGTLYTRQDWMNSEPPPDLPNPPCGIWGRFGAVIRIPREPPL